jgi:hypothetical protein
MGERRTARRRLEFRFARHAMITWRSTKKPARTVPGNCQGETGTRHFARERSFTQSASHRSAVAKLHRHPLIHHKPLMMYAKFTVTFGRIVVGEGACALQSYPKISSTSMPLDRAESTRNSIEPRE